MRPILSVLVMMSIVASMLLPVTTSAAGLDAWMLSIATAELLSSDEAAREAKERYGGRVLSVRLEEPQGRPAYYRVKLITDGNVRVVEIPAER